MNFETVTATIFILGIPTSLLVLSYAHLRRLFLQVDRLLCGAHDLARTALGEPTVFHPVVAETPYRRLRAEAALRVLNTVERCALVLDSLEDSTACAIFEALAYEHQELVGLELLSLSPDLPYGTDVLARGDLAVRLHLSYDELDAYLAQNPEAGAAAMTEILPMTVARQQTTASMLHDLPAHFGSSEGHIPDLKMSALDMLGWLRRRHQGGGDTPAA